MTQSNDPRPNEEPRPAEEPRPQKPAKSHWIKTTWLRRLLKTLMWILICILLLPAVIYIPPVQTALKNLACSIVHKSTGMTVEIEKFRLKFPLDVSLQGVTVIEAAGDTMVRAREAVADVKLLPLLDLDVKLNKLSLLDGYYRMLSPDSSMLMQVKAGRLAVDGKSSMDIPKMRLLLNDAELEDADVSLLMDVWKQKPSEPDSAATPFFLDVRKLRAQRLRFAMSMLPTIDTLVFATNDLLLQNGVIDLSSNSLTVSRLSANGGDFTYLTPTPEYIAAHPLPVDTVPKAPSEPFTVRGKNVDLCGFNVHYAVKGAKPLPGFDAAYIQASGLCISLQDFYNRESTVRLPITALRVKERCGLEITSGSGTVAVDSIGLDISNFRVNTPGSRIQATAQIPFAAMEMKPDARMSVKADTSVAPADIIAFMPDLKTCLSPLGSTPVNLRADAAGSIADLQVKELHADIPDILMLDASGHASDANDIRRLTGKLDIAGELYNPHVVDAMAGGTGIDLPRLSLIATAEARRGRTYLADIDLLTDAGDLVADGSVSLNAESYSLDADIDDFDVARFAPELGVGSVTATVRARGNGFDPSRPGSGTDIALQVASAVYKGHDFRDIDLKAVLADHRFEAALHSPDPWLNADITATGTLEPDNYSCQLVADIPNADLKALGLTPDICQGHACFTLDGSASPGSWLYDVDLKADDIQWQIGEDTRIDLPDGLDARFIALEDSVDCQLYCDLTSLSFRSDSGLQALVDGFSKAASQLTAQIEARNVDVEELQQTLPHFNLAFNAAGRGLLDRFLSPMKMGVDTVYGEFSNTDLIQGHVGALKIRNGDMNVDTITFNLKQRGGLLDYRAHMGNRPGTMDEFADVNANGYLGSNRFSLSLRQQNIKGETGYRLGVTGGVQDSTLSVHFTPLKATIAYMPWTFNADNHVDLGPGRRIDAKLMAHSRESSVLLETLDNPDGDIQVHAKLENIKIQDFLQMSLFGPPMTGTVDSDLTILYKGKVFTGDGTLDVTDFQYRKQKVGNFNMNFQAGLDMEGDTQAKVGLLVNGHEALIANALVRAEETDSLQPVEIGLKLNRFPLDIANPFIPGDAMKLKGALNGQMAMSGKFTRPMLNGYISCDSVSVYLPMMASALRFDDEPLTVKDNVIGFNQFDIWGQNANPLTIDGTVDASKLTDVQLDVAMAASNFQLLNNDKRAGSELYGKAFLDLDASARGPLKHFDINARLQVLKNSNIGYNIPMTAQQLGQATNASDVVKFVVFSDTAQVEKADSLEAATMAMRINAALTIANGTQVTVNLSGNGTDKVEIAPSGTLNYFQNYMGDMRLNGQLNIGTGYAQYNVPVIGRSVKFSFNPDSYVLFNGDIMNPTLNIQATDQMRVVVSQNGTSHPVNFDVGLSVTNNLNAPKVLFDLSTKDDISIENQLQSMTPDQRSSQAMNLLLYGQYTGQGYSGQGITGESMLYGFLTSQLNSWAANNIRGVDLSFGVDQYDSGANGSSGTTTSYSYQVSKSLFNNKFKIVVGGNYSTDASADENFSQNLINDIAFEYMLRQTNNLSMYLKLFRHTGFESVLEGEVTETGVGFVMRRRLSDLKTLFRFTRRRRKAQLNTVPPVTPTDSVTPAAQPAEEPDSITTVTHTNPEPQKDE